MSQEAMKLALEALENNRQTHHYCEDTWYSCPKHEDGCANDSEGDECNCGADKANAEIDSAITSLRQAIAEAEKQEQGEPVACKRCGGSGVVDDGEIDCYEDGTPYENGPIKCVKDCADCTTPQQRKPLTDEEIQQVFIANSVMVDNGNTYMVAGLRAVNIGRAIEAKLKENT